MKEHVIEEDKLCSNRRLVAEIESWLNALFGEFVASYLRHI